MRDFDPTLDYYEILQVHLKAQPEFIKRAYRTLLRELRAHPDLGGSHQQAVLINQAYEVLSDPARRAGYDLARAHRGPAPAAAPPPPAGSGVSYQASTAVTTCPLCGRKNRVPGGINLHRARCGSCGGALAAAPKPPAESEAPNRLRLSPQLYRELCEKSQLELRVERVKKGNRLYCRKCRQPWVAPRTMAPPRVCPACKAKGWTSFRVFKCAKCGHEFRCNSLAAWPYLVYLRCPACQATNWNKTCERSPLRRFLSLFLRA